MDSVSYATRVDKLRKRDVRKFPFQKEVQMMAHFSGSLFAGLGRQTST